MMPGDAGIRQQGFQAAAGPGLAQQSPAARRASCRRRTLGMYVAALWLLDRSFDLFERQQYPMRIEDLRNKDREEILKIAAKHGARNIRIFGSVARGEADSKSDLDILVEFLPGATLLSHSAMIRELESLLKVKVDVVSDRGLRERIRDRVLSEAVPL